MTERIGSALICRTLAAPKRRASEVRLTLTHGRAPFSGVRSVVVNRSLILTAAQRRPRSWSGDTLSVSSELRFRYS